MKQLPQLQLPSRRLPVAACALALAAGVAVGAPAAASAAPAAPVEQVATPNLQAASTDFTRSVAAAIAAQTNSYRIANGRAALTLTPAIDRVAQAWSEHQASVGQMVHRSDYGRSAVPAGSSRTTEILSWGIGTNATADYFMSQWRNSPVHNRILLEHGLTHYGVGVAIAPNGRVYATQNFGTYTRANAPAPHGPGAVAPARAVAPPVTPTFLLAADLGGPVTHRFGYGAGGDQELAGDWNGDGVDTVGVRRGAHFLLTDRFGGVADRDIHFGVADDEVLVGDWDGNGRDELAVRRGNTFIVMSDLSNPWSTYTMRFGDAGDGVIVGDWDGNGADSLAVRRGGDVLARNSMTSGGADLAFSYGDRGDEVLAGDWDGDGVDTVAVRRGAYFLPTNVNRTSGAERSIEFGVRSDTALAGDWDGDGNDSFGIARQ